MSQFANHKLPCLQSLHLKFLAMNDDGYGGVCGGGWVVVTDETSPGSQAATYPEENGTHGVGTALCSLVLLLLLLLLLR
jgi:hypothetical protein